MGKQLYSKHNFLSESLLNDVKHIIDSGRQQAYAAINNAMTMTYWKIGKRIVEEEQKGEIRAEYGEKVISRLSEYLTKEYGNGFSKRYLAYFRKFYITFPEPQILQTCLQNLRWSHLRKNNFEKR